MNQEEFSRQVANEAVNESHFRTSLNNRRKTLSRQIISQTSNTFTTKYKTENNQIENLIGRVRISEPKELLEGGRDYYIGTSFYEDDSITVYSWGADVADTLYLAEDQIQQGHEWCAEVEGRRVFEHKKNKIVYFDEIRFDGSEAPLFALKKHLFIPKAPELSKPVITNRTAKSTLETEENQEPAKSAGFQTSYSKQFRRVNAEQILLRQLSAPKKVAMSTVLATLQPDQYRHATQSAEANQFLQGHPGTGKTIIAVHRAALMLNEEAYKSWPEVEPKGKVLILGPSEEFVKHISSAMEKLTTSDKNYEIQSLPHLLDRLAKFPKNTTPTKSFTYESSSQELARLADIANKVAKSKLAPGARLSLEDVYRELKNLLKEPPENGLEKNWVDFLKDLPIDVRTVKERQNYELRALLAYIAKRITPSEDYGHIIIDEAQDITPLEWEVIGLLGNKGGWTILGDLNQRRSDFTFGSWDKIAEMLAIEDESGKAPVTILDRGYRSTTQIIKFANQLLPKKDRELISFQTEGNNPDVIKISNQANLFSEACLQAERLLDLVPDGTIAIISMSNESMTNGMRKQGWVAELSDIHIWKKDGKTIQTFTPDRSRGLEFDGVVVVEPSDFPENAGRLGALYTALTRANKFLAVLHQKPLPKQLKSR